MPMEKDIQEYVSQITAVFGMLPGDELKEVIEILAKAYQGGRQVFTMGNGGHASTASHWAQGLLRYPIISQAKDKVVIKKRMKAMCLCDSVTTLTGWANDMGYEHCFSEQLEHWANKGDVVIGFSGSGNSKNVLEAFHVAKDRGATTICFTGSDGGKAREVVDICFIVPTGNMDYVEDVHLSLNHFCCKMLRKIMRQESEPSS